ncbi:MAG: sugar transferase [Acidobacteriota bacterium]
MFGDRSRVYSKISFGADIAVGLPALLAAYSLRSLIRFAPSELSRHFNPELLPFHQYFFFYLGALPFLILLLMATQRYFQLLHLPLWQQAVRVGQFMVGTGFLMGFLVFTFKLEISRPIFFCFIAAFGLLLQLNRTVLYWVLRSRNINPHNQINLLIVGTGERALMLEQLLARFRRWGFHVLGYVSIEDQAAPVPGTKLLGTLEDLPRLLCDHIAADEIIFVGSDLTDLASFEGMIKLCEELGLRIRVAADFFPTSTSRVSMEFLESLPLITFSTVPDHGVSLVAKRVVDFFVAAASLALLSPLLLLIAILVRLTSSGPILYCQTRSGLYGRKFNLVKFRTMIEGAEDRLWEVRHLNEMSGPVFKMRNDPRVTSLGKYLRKYSLDELPQFWNVIKGEMSIVGPRAPLPEEVHLYSLRQRRRLSVKPGITCLWQVSGRNDIDFQKWMDLDLDYIDNWSFWLDLRIMLKTIPAVFGARGAR